MPDDEESEPEALLASFLSSRFFLHLRFLLYGVAVATIVLIVDSNSE